MLNFTKTTRLSRFVNFAVCGILLSSVSIKTEDDSVLAQEIKTGRTPLLVSQRFPTRELRAESGPDDKGRWRFYKPNDVSLDEMRSQGCTFVGTGSTPWRCSSRKIRVQVNNNNNNNQPNYGYGDSTRELRAESGPDDKNRWRFYKPNDVSLDEMRSQGCVFVGGGTPWRCSNRKIRVRVNNNNNNQPNYGYGGSTRELRAESGPDDKNRWRFYKPNDVSWDSMQAQGCTHVGTSAGHPAPWRCPRQKIKVQVDNRP
ncbi:hypothetical protein [Calothrix sp. UHCC 0171]|uniref:hypothetical protein n=1 Tax=Calothrix sp. UHCC 0171 TaxID=3110245 RepID=UPI002B21273E|nr:hypothetical protein [Calothrix sp. UHCC 0171]MEA5571941.1 hypothetical protein [Calothrix sp. UHCC 0171]